MRTASPPDTVPHGVKARRRRNAFFVLALFGLLTPCLIVGAGLSVGTNSNQLSDWLPANLEETADLRQFNDWFGDGQFVIISWEGCRVDLSKTVSSSVEATSPGDDPRLARLAGLLKPSTTTRSEMILEGPSNRSVSSDAMDNDRASEPEPVASVLTEEEKNRFFRKVLTSRDLLQTLQSPPLNIPAAEAIKRLTGTIVGTEGQACCLVFLTDEATADLRLAVGFRHRRWIDSAAPQGALFRAIEASGIPLESARLGGPPIDNLSINEEGQRTLVRLAIAAGGLGLALSWWSLRSVVLTLIVFSCGMMSTCGATAMIWVTGCHADAIVLAMPSLIYVLTISGAIHLVNYYRDEVQRGGVDDAVGRAMRAGRKPATLCSVTTALGLLSLLSSDLTPIRRFGIFSALGMLLMLVVLFLFLPAAMEFFGTRRSRRGQLAFGFAVDGPSQLLPLRNEHWTEEWTTRWSDWVTHRHRWVLAMGLLVMVGLSGGIAQIRTSVDLLELFDSRARILADYKWLEKNLGNLVPLEVLIKFDSRWLIDEDQQGTMLQRAVVVERIRQQIDAKFGERGTNLMSPPMSVSAFLPKLPTEHRGTRAVIRNRITNQKLNDARDSLLATGYLIVDEKTGDEVWRISLRVAAFKGVDYGVLADEVRHLVDPLVTQASQRMSTRNASDANDAIKPVVAIHTGVIPIIYKAQRELLNSLIESTWWSFVTITPLLMWITRGLGAGLIAMLPNLLPVLAVFGTMGWTQISVDIGCMMTASIALGVAVDDTIHFLCWYRHAQESESNRVDAIRKTFQSCCRPTIQAAVINGLGLSVFLLSTFVPTKQFGLLMLAILVCGVVSELLLLPAILASPLGLAFERKPVSQPKSPIVDLTRSFQQHTVTTVTKQRIQ